jgi:TetR/AcrR family transcriptional regulator, repressor for uid operon
VGRRASNDSAETFDRIVATATAILSASGAAQLTLRRVASETGLRLGTVQYYFASKDALIEHLLAEHSESLRARMDLARAALAAGVDIEDVIVAGVRAMYHQRGDERETYRLRVLWAVSSSGDQGHALVLTRELHQMARLLEEHAHIGEIEARLIVHTMAMLVARYSIHPEPELRALLGLPAEADLHDAVEEHLASVTRAVLRDARVRAAAVSSPRRSGTRR